MQRSLGILHSELDDNADADRYLVRCQDLLAFDGQVALANVDEG